jgi:purine-cytosine permease-like protein
MYKSSAFLSPNKSIRVCRYCGAPVEPTRPTVLLGLLLLCALAVPVTFLIVYAMVVVIPDVMMNPQGQFVRALSNQVGSFGPPSSTALVVAAIPISAFALYPLYLTILRLFFGLTRLRTANLKGYRRR